LYSDFLRGAAVVACSGTTVVWRLRQLYP